MYNGMILRARVWIWWNEGWVKITVEQNHPFELYKGGWTDEGWYRHYETYEFDGEYVTVNTVDEEKDCDGRLDRCWEHKCKYDNLKTDFKEEGFWGPLWERGREGQRDYEAEKCGY